MKIVQNNLKDQRIEKILEAVIELEVTKGSLLWKMSDVARISGVTRSLIYYYFGKDKKTLLQTTVDYYVDEFFSFKLDRREKIRRGEIMSLISAARKKLTSRPYFLQFYAKHRQGISEIGLHFKKAEHLYFENLRETLSTRWRPLSRIIWALIFGLAIQPGLTDEDLKVAERFLIRAWPKKLKH